MPTFHSKPAIDNSKKAQSEPSRGADLKDGSAPKTSKSSK